MIASPAARPWVLVATIAASSMAFVDGTLVHLALPLIQADLGAPFPWLQWVANAYSLGLSALVVLGGALGDRIGRRRVFLAGIVVFAVSSVACAAAPSIGVLVAARAAQGVGAALLVPQSLAILAVSYPSESRGSAIGAWSAASALTTGLGPTVGGLLVDALSWRAAFWINVPLAIVAVALTVRFVPESRDEVHDGPLDWLGAALATAGLGLVTWGLTRWPEIGPGSAEVALSLMGGVSCGVAFVFAERSAKAPLTPPRLFTPRFTALNVLTLALYTALGGLVFLLPVLLLQVKGFTASSAGLVFVPFGVVLGVLSRPAGAWADRVGERPFLVLGSLLVGVGCAIAGVTADVGPSLLGAVAGVVVLAVGLSLVLSPLTTAVLGAVESADTGAASGVNNAAARVAGLLSVALCGAVALAVFGPALELELAARGVPTAESQRLLGDVARMAGIDAAGEGRDAVRAAFVIAFKAAMIPCVLLAWAAAAIGLAVGERPR